MHTVEISGEVPEHEPCTRGGHGSVKAFHALQPMNSFSIGLCYAYYRIGLRVLTHAVLRVQCQACGRDTHFGPNGTEPTWSV